MTYTVTWVMAAIARYNQMLAAADDPGRIVQAAAWMDQSLRRPFDVGESWATPGERLWYDDVLGLYYHADRDAMTVRVLSVGPARRR